MQSEMRTCQKHENIVVVWLYPDEEMCCPLCLALRVIEEQRRRLEKLENNLVPF